MLSNSYCVLCGGSIPDKDLEKAYKEQPTISVSCPHCGKLNMIHMEMLEKSDETIRISREAQLKAEELSKGGP